MKSDCSKLADKFTILSEKALQQVSQRNPLRTLSVLHKSPTTHIVPLLYSLQGVRETSGFTESVNLFLDQITAYQVSISIVIYSNPQ